MATEKNFQLFARLSKVNEATRQITGIIASETPDAAGESMDYETSKPHFQSWSEGMSKASGGKNVGNVRVMHGLIAAGGLSEIIFHDDQRQIEATANIVDDAEWKKVIAGTYTGFSVGGKYLRKWNDGSNRRYTAKPHEVSLVDSPCIPDATFELVKADGATALMKFSTGGMVAADVSQTPTEHPTNPPVDLFAGVREQLAKVAKAGTEAIAEKLLVKLLAGDAQVIEGVNLAKEIVRGEKLEKGMYTCASLCRLLEDLGCVQSSVAWEAKYENDGSAMPADLAAAAKEVGRILVSMVQEEVGELTAIADKNVAQSKEPVLMLAAQAEDLQKAQGALAESNELMQKVTGERDEAKADLKKAMFAVEESSTALAKLNGEVGDLKKTIATRDATIQELEAKIKAPAVMAVSKENDIVQKAGGEVEVKKVVGEGGTVDPVATVLKAVHATGGQRV
jgi:hypothetical protein